MSSLSTEAQITTRALLRSATADDHASVDAAFSRFDLNTKAGYIDFLTAHARVLHRAERLIDPGTMLARWVGRSDALRQDLSSLGEKLPRELDFDLPGGEAARWGALYVLEGSRLGGDVIARRLPPGFPAAYLKARHPKGAWQAILTALEQADQGELWQQAAIDGARSLFSAYRKAAWLDPPSIGTASRH